MAFLGALSRACPPKLGLTAAATVGAIAFGSRPGSSFAAPKTTSTSSSTTTTVTTTTTTKTVLPGAVGSRPLETFKAVTDTYSGKLIDPDDVRVMPCRPVPCGAVPCGAVRCGAAMCKRRVY